MREPGSRRGRGEVGLNRLEGTPFKFRLIRIIIGGGRGVGYANLSPSEAGCVIPAARCPLQGKPLLLPSHLLESALDLSEWKDEDEFSVKVRVSCRDCPPSG